MVNNIEFIRRIVSNSLNIQKKHFKAFFTNRYDFHNTKQYNFQTYKVAFDKPKTHPKTEFNDRR